MSQWKRPLCLLMCYNSCIMVKLSVFCNIYFESAVRLGFKTPSYTSTRNSLLTVERCIIPVSWAAPLGSRRWERGLHEGPSCAAVSHPGDGWGRWRLPPTSVRRDTPDPEAALHSNPTDTKNTAASTWNTSTDQQFVLWHRKFVFNINYLRIIWKYYEDPTKHSNIDIV